jgi:hypothetical protein
MLMVELVQRAEHPQRGLEVGRMNSSAVDAGGSELTVTIGRLVGRHTPGYPAAGPAPFGS